MQRLDQGRGAKPIPGKTMPALRVVRRDYANLYNQFISLGPLVPKNGLGAHGTQYRVDDLYDGIRRSRCLT